MATTPAIIIPAPLNQFLASLGNIIFLNLIFGSLQNIIHSLYYLVLSAYINKITKFIQIQSNLLFITENFRPNNQQYH